MWGPFEVTPPFEHAIRLDGRKTGIVDFISLKNCEEEREALEPAAQRHGFWIIEARQGTRHGPYVFYSPMTGDKCEDVKAPSPQP